MRVFRPADAVETAECWQLALERRDGPSVLALTRQILPQVAQGGRREPLRRGRLRALAGERAGAATIFASGSEVEIALSAQAMLAERSVAARVVSVPSLDLFLAQPEACGPRIIGKAPIRVAVEAAVRFGWDALIGPTGIFVGMSGFRRERALQGPLPAFRHHRRGGGRARTEHAQR